MVTYLDLLNRARARQGSTPISALAIGDNSGDSLQGVAAVSAAVAGFYENTYDLDASDKIASITTSSGTSLLTPPIDTWDTNVIKAVKYLDSGNNTLVPLSLIDPITAEDYKLLTYNSNEPQYWWVNQMQVYVLPVPVTTYNLKVFYQALYPDITSSNMTNTVMLPDSALKTLVDGIYARLREQIGDPQWGTYYQIFEQNVLKYHTARNKYTYKRQGFQKFKVFPRFADRRL